MAFRFGSYLGLQCQFEMRQKLQELCGQITGLRGEKLNAAQLQGDPIDLDPNQLLDTILEETNNFNLLSRSQRRIVDSIPKEYTECFPIASEDFEFGYIYGVAKNEEMDPLTPEIQQVQSDLIRYKGPGLFSRWDLKYHILDVHSGHQVLGFAFFDRDPSANLFVYRDRYTDRQLQNRSAYRLHLAK